MQTLRRVVGRISKPHGVRGELQIEVRTDEPELRFAPGNTLLLDDNQLKIVSAKVHGKYLLVKFEGFESRNDVEHLRNGLLEVIVNIATTPADEDEFYDYQLVGLDVIVHGETIGTTKEVLHLPAQDVLVVMRNGEELLIPFVKEIVTEVNIEKKFVVVSPPPGLLEEVPDED